LSRIPQQVFGDRWPLLPALSRASDRARAMNRLN
jgi:hypothetical protein